MGLDTTHDCWHGPYSMFMRWREWLAQQVGLPLLAMETFCGPGMWAMTAGCHKAECVGIPWSILKPDPLYALLNHSDCDGEILLADLPGLEKRLREIAATTENVPGHGGPEHARGCYDSMHDACIRFADGCQRAIEAGENVEFH